MIWSDWILRYLVRSCGLWVHQDQILQALILTEMTGDHRPKTPLTSTSYHVLSPSRCDTGSRIFVRCLLWSTWSVTCGADELIIITWHAYDCICIYFIYWFVYWFLYEYTGFRTQQSATESEAPFQFKVDLSVNLLPRLQHASTCFDMLRHTSTCFSIRAHARATSYCLQTDQEWRIVHCFSSNASCKMLQHCNTVFFLKHCSTV